MRWGVSPLYSPLSVQLLHSIPRYYSGEYPRLSRGRPGFNPRRGDSFGVSEFYFTLFFFFLVLTLKFDMKGAFDGSFSEIRLYLKFLFQISSNVNVTSSLLNFNLADALCMFSMVHPQAQTSVAKYQFVSFRVLVSLSSALTMG